jgi:hypothetical protein
MKRANCGQVRDMSWDGNVSCSRIAAAQLDPRHTAYMSSTCVGESSVSTISMNNEQPPPASLPAKNNPHTLIIQSSTKIYPTYKLADTAVLELDVTEALETLLVGVGEETEGVEEAKGGLDTELVLEGGESGGGGTLLGGGEGGGAGNKAGEESELHLCVISC